MCKTIITPYGKCKVEMVWRDSGISQGLSTPGSGGAPPEHGCVDYRFFGGYPFRGTGFLQQVLIPLFGPIEIPLFVTPADGLPFIILALAPGQGQGQLGLSVLEIHLQGDERKPLFIDFAV